MRCLSSIKELNYPNYNIIVVDNASSLHHLNNTRLFIENEKQLKRISTCQLISSNENLGYSGGNNLGIRYAMKHGADYVFILNPDTTLEKNALTELIKMGETNPRIGIFGPTINESGTTVYGGYSQWLRPELSLNTKYQLLNTSYYVSGAAMLIKKGVVKKIGLLDERYFLYFEDTDYCARSQKAGFRLNVVPDAVITHSVSTSTGSLGAPLLLRYHFRNAHLFNWKNGPWFIILALPFWSIFIIIKQLIKLAFAPSKREVSWSILAGVLDFYCGRFGKIK